MTIHKYCAEWRRSKGLTQQNMADALNVEVSSVTRFERGKMNSFKILLGYILAGMEIDREKIEGDADD